MSVCAVVLVAVEAERWTSEVAVVSHVSVDEAGELIRRMRPMIQIQARRHGRLVPVPSISSLALVVDRPLALASQFPTSHELLPVSADARDLMPF